MVSKFYSAPRILKSVENTKQVNNLQYFTNIRRFMANSKPRLVKKVSK